jgi:hypothetical protein
MTNEEMLERLKPQPEDDEETLASKARFRKDIIENPDVSDDGSLVEWTPEQYARARGKAYISVRVPMRKRDEE